jgi:hypothetical protein
LSYKVIQWLFKSLLISLKWLYLFLKEVLTFWPAHFEELQSAPVSISITVDITKTTLSFFLTEVLTSGPVLFEADYQGYNMCVVRAPSFNHKKLQKSSPSNIYKSHCLTTLVLSIIDFLFFVIRTYIQILLHSLRIIIKPICIQRPLIYYLFILFCPTTVKKNL